MTRRARPPGPRAALCLAAAVAACDGQGYVVGANTAAAAAAASSAGQATPSTQSSSTGSAGASDGTTTPSTATTTTPDPSPAKSTCSATADTFDNFAKAAIASNCASCHSGEWDTVGEASANVSSLRGQISAGTMPPSGQLDATVKQRLLTWLNCPTPLP